MLARRKLAKWAHICIALHCPRCEQRCSASFLQLLHCHRAFQDYGSSGGEQVAQVISGLFRLLFCRTLFLSVSSSSSSALSFWLLIFLSLKISLAPPQFWSPVCCSASIPLSLSLPSSGSHACLSVSVLLIFYLPCSPLCVSSSLSHVLSTSSPVARFHFLRWFALQGCCTASLSQELQK